MSCFPLSPRSFRGHHHRLILINFDPAADVALAQRLGEELKYETEAAAPSEPEFLKAFKAQGTWAVSSPMFVFHA